MNIYLKTFGCAVNQSESEIIKGILSKKHKFTNPKEAQIIIINICTVKGDKKALKEIRKFKDKELIITGCISKDIIPEIYKIKNNISLINTHNITKIEQAVKNNITLLNKTKEIKLNLPKIRKNNLISIIPISSGCRGNCTYCSVKLIKGDIINYPENLILKEVNNSLKTCKEIWITAQDTAAHKNLIQILNKIINIKSNFKIRIGMMNPNNLIPILKPLINIYQSNKIYKFLHLPLQSASNKILKRMNRKYTKQQYYKLIKIFKANIKDLNLATDIIIGFPGETNKDFNETYNFIKKIKPDNIYISKYRPRSGTKASKLKQVNPDKIKQRTKKLLKLFHKISLQNNEKYINKTYKVIINEKNYRNSIARTPNYKQILLPKNLMIGQELNIKTTKSERFGLRGIVTK